MLRTPGIPILGKKRPLLLFLLLKVDPGELSKAVVQSVASIECHLYHLVTKQPNDEQQKEKYHGLLHAVELGASGEKVSHLYRVVDDAGVLKILLDENHRSACPYLEHALIRQARVSVLNVLKCGADKRLCVIFVAYRSDKHASLLLQT